MCNPSRCDVDWNLPDDGGAKSLDETHTSFGCDRRCSVEDTMEGCDMRRARPLENSQDSKRSVLLVAAYAVVLSMAVSASAGPT